MNKSSTKNPPPPPQLSLPQVARSISYKEIRRGEEHLKSKQKVWGLDYQMGIVDKRKKP
jgi:hypothetical protein